MKKLQRELEEQKRKNQEQQSTIQALNSKKSKRQVVGKLKVSTEIEEKVKELAGMLGPKLWRTTKFINNEEQEYEACKIVMKALHEMKDCVEDNIDAFVATYGGTVCKTINDARSNAQSGMKKAYLEYKAANPKFKMPTPKELINVQKRKKEDLLFPPEDQKPKAPDPKAFKDGKEAEDFKTQKTEYEKAMDHWKKEHARINRNRQIIKWYWTKLLPCVAGSKRWSKNIRCYGCISSHTFPDNTALKYITSADEALVAILYENCGQRWPFLAEQAKGNPTYQVTKADKADKRYNSAYSDTKAGQKKYGGWNETGRERFENLEKKFRVAKKKEHVKDLEKEILALIQKEENIGTGKKKRKERKLDKFEQRNDWRKVGVESDALSDIEGEDESDDDDYEVIYGKQKDEEEEEEDQESPTKKARKSAPPAKKSAPAAKKSAPTAKPNEEEDEEEEEDDDEEKDEEDNDP